LLQQGLKHISLTTGERLSLQYKGMTAMRDLRPDELNNISGGWQQQQNTNKKMTEKKNTQKNTEKKNTEKKFN
jgi:hypothetical protein